MKRIFVIVCFLVAAATRVTAQQPALQEDLALKYLMQLPAETSKHAPVIILLHGYGSNEKDLFDLRSFFPKNYIVISVRAPYSLSTGGGYQWYESATINGKRDGKKDQLDNSRQLITTLITQVVKKYKADAKNVYVMGFSQGAIMSYQVGLTDPAAVKGIGVLSGTIFNSLKPMVKASPELNRLRIFISHGTADERIPFNDGKAASDYLKSIGLKPEFHAYDGMGHQINKEVLKDLLAWLK